MDSLNYTLEPGDYKHYKGNLYEVLYTAHHTETGERVVVYKALYGDFGIWVRPFDMFIESVEIDGVVRPRFEKLAKVAGV